MSQATENQTSEGKWPKDVGIIAMEVYIPKFYVDQNELELHDGVSVGKYTKGLGQNRMALCCTTEDIYSMCLTVTKNLLERNYIKQEEIGRLEVGTETIIDKSKSVKSVLMQLFEDNTDIEGVDTMNACYGGTAALFNALNWIESSAWDKRYALVVCGDIAMYADKTARPTGGAGAIAMLVGPNAPLIVERGVRSSYMTHVYDFYKPILNSCYPIVNGKFSIKCYFSALDKCYNLYKEKTRKSDVEPVNSIDDFEGIIFHCPFSKLVQKSVARLAYNDYLSSSDEEKREYKDVPNVTIEESYDNKEIETFFLEASKSIFTNKTLPSLWLAKEVGNMYTPSLYGGLVSYLLSKDISELFGDRLGLFSYGSGLASSFFSIRITDASNELKLRNLRCSLLLLKKNLEDRIKLSPAHLESVLSTFQAMLTKPAKMTLTLETLDEYYPGTYYLEDVDNNFARTYSRYEPDVKENSMF